MPYLQPTQPVQLALKKLINAKQPKTPAMVHEKCKALSSMKTTYHLCSIINCLLRMESSIFARNSLADHFRAFVYKDSGFCRIAGEGPRSLHASHSIFEKACQTSRPNHLQEVRRAMIVKSRPRQKFQSIFLYVFRSTVTRRTLSLFWAGDRAPL
jgi:hypothetical protein